MKNYKNYIEVYQYLIIGKNKHRSYHNIAPIKITKRAKDGIFSISNKSSFINQIGTNSKSTIKNEFKEFALSIITENKVSGRINSFGILTETSKPEISFQITTKRVNEIIQSQTIIKGVIQEKMRYTTRGFLTSDEIKETNKNLSENKRQVLETLNNHSENKVSSANLIPGCLYIDRSNPKETRSVLYLGKATFPDKKKGGTHVTYNIMYTLSENILVKYIKNSSDKIDLTHQIIKNVFKAIPGKHPNIVNTVFLKTDQKNYGYVYKPSTIRKKIWSKLYKITSKDLLKYQSSISQEDIDISLSKIGIDDISSFNVLENYPYRGKAPYDRNINVLTKDEILKCIATPGNIMDFLGCNYNDLIAIDVNMNHYL